MVQCGTPQGKKQLQDCRTTPTKMRRPSQEGCTNNKPKGRMECHSDGQNEMARYMFECMILMVYYKEEEEERRIF